MSTPRQFHFQTIGVIRSVFKEKFGIPRQSGLIGQAEATLEILPPYNRPEAFRGLEVFSHVWVQFVFHANRSGDWSPTVRPPRLGGNQRVGVFATRSGFRPNPLGLSVVKLAGIEVKGRDIRLKLKGVDLMDGTPVVDIKPYLPYADAISEAHGGFANQAPEQKLKIEFTSNAACQLAQREAKGDTLLRELIDGVLSQDPRPAYQRETSGDRVYACQLADVDLRWRMEGGAAIVLSLERKEE